MNIEIEQKTIEDAAQKAVQKTLDHSFADYRVEAMMNASMTQAIQDSGIVASIQTATSKALKEAIEPLCKSLAEQIAKSATKQAMRVLNEGLANIIYSMRIGTQYMTSEQRAAELTKIKAELEL